MRLLALALLLLVIATAAACPYAGRFLIVDEPLQPSDAIVVLAGDDVERWLEGVDLYREGYAPLILLSPGYEEPLGDRLRASGIRFPRRIEAHRDAMIQLGVPESAIEILRGGYDNTADEAAGVMRLARERAWSRLIVVTSKYHTRRTRFAFRRQFEDADVQIIVRGSRHDDAAPDGWWKRRADLRWVVTELQKLVAYRLGLSQ